MSSPKKWWLAGGAIPERNCLEHIEYPSIGQLYAGASIADGNPWTIAITTTWNGSVSQFAIDVETGRTVLGVGTTTNGFYVGSAWYDRTLFIANVQHVYFLICTIVETQAYRDAAPIGLAASPDPAFSGTIRWRSTFNDPAGNMWATDILKAAIYDINLGAVRQAALYATMR